ncbi:MAG TPA: hypothetical protein VI566_07660 [Xanthomonadales bacterium]|nr:hypothetical protein [Xanthomonadales bacterium]
MRLTPYLTGLLSIALCLAAGAALALDASTEEAATAAQRLPVPNWDRELALQTAVLGADEARLQHWYGLARSGETAALFQSVADFSRATGVSAPVREQQLFLFVQGLADFSPELMPLEVLDYLATWPVQTWVAHEESVASAVPLFNIPAAVAGLRHAVEFQQAERRAAKLLATLADKDAERAADLWLEAYLAGSASEQKGFYSALDDATPGQLEQLGKMAREGMATQAGLVAVAGRAALAAQDREALQQILQTARGPGLAPILRNSVEILPALERAVLLLNAAETAPAENTALAIALLAPGLQQNQQVTESLFDLLADPALGASAGLALSHYTSATVRQRLLELAAGGDLAAKRARLALAAQPSGAGQ